MTCGIAPAVLLAEATRGQRALVDDLAPRLYVAAIAWRVVRYGFPPRESHVFTGMPVTGAGVVMAAGFQLGLAPRAMSYLSLAVVGTMLSTLPVLSGEAIVRRGARGQDLRPPS